MRKPQIKRIAIPEDCPLDISASFVNLDHQQSPYTIEFEVGNPNDFTVAYSDKRDVFFEGKTAKNFVLYPKENFNAYKYSEQSKVYIAEERMAWTADVKIGSLNPQESISKEQLLLHEYISDPSTDSPVPYPSELIFTTRIKADKSNPNERPIESIENANWYKIAISIEF